MQRGLLPRAANLYDGGPITLTIYDTGGYDRLDLGWDTADQRVDLRPEGISDVLGLTGNLSIGPGTIIERFNAGSGHDTVIGNEAANFLEGHHGNDTLVGGTGDDWLVGGPGADRLDGGAGDDGVSYLWSEPGVRVDLGAGEAAGGDADGDTLRGIEHLRGSAHDDALTGSDASNLLLGRDGNDTLDGGAGNDWLNGGPGDDVLEGSAGDDTFIFDGEPNGEDVVRDFADARSSAGEQDYIELSGGFSFSSLRFMATGNDVVITRSDRPSSIHITLEDYLVDHQISDLGPDDFLFS